jgi:hypothetical protein
MIRLKSLLEIVDDELQRLLDKIKNKQFRFLGSGDNGRVYEIDGEDRCFKITQERDEFEVAKVIVGRWSEFTTFIPVYYVDEKQHMYIMANAEPIPGSVKSMINKFLQDFTQYARAEGGEVSIFEFLDNDGARNTDPKLVNFLRALQQDVERTGIEEFDLDFDFNSDNVMMWDNKIVLVDW